jgi:hypothetical protein
MHALEIVGALYAIGYVPSALHGDLVCWKVGRAGVFRDYRLRVTGVIRDYSMSNREAMKHERIVQGGPPPTASGQLAFNSRETYRMNDLERRRTVFKECSKPKLAL